MTSVQHGLQHNAVMATHRCSLRDKSATRTHKHTGLVQRGTGLEKAYRNLFRKFVLVVVKVRTVREQTLRSHTLRSVPETPKYIRNEYVSKSCWPRLSARERQRVIGVRTTTKTF